MRVVVKLIRVAPNTNEQRSLCAFCERVICREATETEGLVYKSNSLFLPEQWKLTNQTSV